MVMRERDPGRDAAIQHADEIVRRLDADPRHQQLAGGFVVFVIVAPRRLQDRVGTAHLFELAAIGELQEIAPEGACDDQRDEFVDARRDDAGLSFGAGVDHVRR
jgi:hypothetical protein